jgi:hypothetical protein
LVALCGWLIPGAGYLLIGQWVRGALIGGTILALFVLGLLIAGVRVIDVPGYEKGEAVFLTPSGQRANHPGPEDRWALVARPVAELADKPWFVGQILAGPVTLFSAKWSVSVARPSQAHPDGVMASHGRVAEIGTLYTAVAGMLNLLAMIDAAWRAGLSDEAVGE